MIGGRVSPGDLRSVAAPSRLPRCDTMRYAGQYSAPAPNPGRILPSAWTSFGARHCMVNRTVVAQFSADMSVILGTHVHVQEPKMLTSCICTSSAIKHVDRHTGSLASPLHVVSPSALSTFKTFSNSSFPGWACPFVSAKAPKTSQKGVKLRKNQEICRCPWIWK